jgi:hypothetical protein
MKEPNYAPVYCAIYPGLAKITRELGWALAIHGTLARDFDLICIPWTDEPANPQVVLEAVTRVYALRKIGELTAMKHGRTAQTVSIAHGECAIDLSFMPRLRYLPTKPTESCTCTKCGWSQILDDKVQRVSPTTVMCPNPKRECGYIARVVENGFTIDQVTEAYVKGQLDLRVQAQELLGKFIEKVAEKAKANKELTLNAENVKTMLSKLQQLGLILEQ